MRGDRFVRRARRGVEPLSARLGRSPLAQAVVARGNDALGALQMMASALALLRSSRRCNVVKGFTDALRVEVQEVDKLAVAITLIQPTAVDPPFPQHGKNYMEKEPKLPSPMIEPEKVAAAILHAATDATTEVKVGAMSKLNATLAKLSPTLAKKLEGMQASRQQYDEAPRDPEGTLDKPGEAGPVSGQTRGTGPARNGARPAGR